MWIGERDAPPGHAIKDLILSRAVWGRPDDGIRILAGVPFLGVDLFR
jgi:hypothetical protein